MWLQKMKLFAGFFDSSAVDAKEAAEFQKNFLDKNKFNVTETLKELAPSCEDLILKCQWAGKLHECSSLFVKYATSIGYCCIFNYMRNFDHEDSNTLKYPKGIGEEQGLTLLLNTSKNDYFLTDGNFVGFTLQIFNFADFPDPSTGGNVRKAFVPQGSIVNLRVRSLTQVASDDLAAYSLKQRVCYLQGENIDGDHSRYSSDKCMTRCKAHGVLRLCGCIPYYTPRDFIESNVTNFIRCTLAHLECLEQNRAVLNTYTLFWPFDDLISSNQALNCNECAPLCDYNSYTFYKVNGRLRDVYLMPRDLLFLKLIAKQRMNDENFNYSNNALKKLINKSVDLSIVRVYFDSLNAVQLSKHSLYSWYDILSNIGGIIGIFMGCSLISAIELLYFFIFKFIVKIRKHLENARTEQQSKH